MDQEDLHDMELKRELNRLYAEGETDCYEAAQRRKRLLIKLASLLVALVFISTLAGSWLKTFQYPPLSFIRESWELNRDPVVRELRRAVVRVEATRAGTAQSAPARYRGTGFNIDGSGIIVTNRHLVEGADYIVVSFAGGRRYPAVSWYWSAEADLAVLLLESEGFPAVSPDFDFVPQAGEEVIIIGNPLSSTGIALRGVIVDTGPAVGSGETVALIGAPIHPGHSGSPVFNGAGRVVGVVYAAAALSDPEKPFGLAVLLPALREMLDKLEILGN